MELTASQENDIKHALRKHPNGIAFDKLFDETTLFVEKRDLSGAIFRMTQQATIYKNGNLFLLTDTAPSVAVKSVAEKPMKETVAVKPTSTKVTPWTKAAVVHPKAKPDPAEVVAKAVAKAAIVAQPIVAPQQTKLGRPPNGDLRRHTITGKAAMVLYRYRNEGYSLPVARIVSCLTEKAPNIYVSMNTLESKGYVKRHGTGRDTIYNWSGKFNYPFSEVEDGDNLLCRVAPKSERDSTLGLAILPTATPQIPESIPAEVLPGTSVDAVLVTDKDSAASPNQIVSSKPMLPSPGVSIYESSYPTGSNGNCTCNEITPSNPAHAAITAIDQKIAVHQAHVDFLKDLRTTLLTALSSTSVPV